MVNNPSSRPEQVGDPNYVDKAAERQEREREFDRGIRRNRRMRLVRMRKLIRLADKIEDKMHN